MRPYTKLTQYFLMPVIAVALVVASVQITTATKKEPVRMIPGNFNDLAESVNPAVVNIRTEKTVKGGGRVFHQFDKNPFGGDERFKDFFDSFPGREHPQEFKQRSLGSGFIIDTDGYIVTNNHVVEGADKIKVALKDEQEFDAEIIGRDPQTDIALIKVKSNRKFPTVRIGNSDDLEVGQWVVAIGNPFGLGHTVTAGIVSAKGRVIGSGPYDDFIQTDASINPGNSGGPLINLKGEVVGINTMIIAGGQGIGFAIPIDLAKGVIEQLKANGEVTRGWLGVTIQTLSGDLAEYYDVEEGTGVLVADVVAGNPADQAGIQPKDIIVEVNGEKVTTSRDLTTLVADLGVGETVKVMVLRDGKPRTFEVVIGKRPVTLATSGNKQEGKETDFGFQVTELTPEIARRLNLAEDKGVVVVGVKPNSKAENAGIQQGDLIIEVNRQKVESLSDFKTLIHKYKKGNTLDLLVKRVNAGLMVIHLA